MNQTTIDLLKAALLAPTPVADEIAKAFSQSTGLVFYDLEPAAKTLYPVLTPLRNRISRVKANGGTATNWKAITNVNINGMRGGVAEGQRGGVIADQVADRTAAYRGMGLENSVTFEAEDAAEGFDDARARASQSLLNSFLLEEERTILGGNGSLALGTTPTPTLAASNIGGTLATATLSVICVALTHIAWKYATLSASGIPLTATRTNADGSTVTVNSGAAQKSANATVSVTGPTGSATGAVAPVNGAVAYAWFWGAAGSERLGAITTINSVSITANAGGANQLATALPAADHSRDALVYDGALSQLATPGSGAIIYDMPTGTPGAGTPFTSDGASGIVEIDAMLERFWNDYKLSPDTLWMSGSTLIALSKIVVANGGAPLYRVNSGTGGATISAGVVVGSYLNKITNKLLEVVVHPEMANGQVLFWSNSVPYPVANIANLMQMKMRRDYYQISWPQRTRMYEFGVYADGLLQCYFPPAFGWLRNAKV